MEMLTGKNFVEQVNHFSFINFSLCFYFYFSTGYFWLFYKRILANEYPGRICPAT